MKQFFAAYFRTCIIGGIIFGFSSGCKIIDPAEEIPSYLHINSISLSVSDPATQGSSTSDITDAWIFMDGQLIGGFELPCTVPILAEGNHHFLIRGGVKMNGLSSTRAIYPKWRGWEGDVSLIRGQKVSVDPVVIYFPAIVPVFIEDFDQTGTLLSAESNSSGILVRDSIPFAFEGNHSGYMHLNNTDTTSVIISTPTPGFNMPAANETWIEFNYWCDGPFTCGIEDDVNSSYHVPWVTVGSSWAWKKIYIRLTDALAAAENEQGSNHNYKIYFAALNPAGQAESHFYLDNIKLLK